MRGLSAFGRRRQGASSTSSVGGEESSTCRVQASRSQPKQPKKPSNKEDTAIAATASDAILSKLNAVSAGYYHDPFIAHFAHGAEGLTASSSSLTTMPAGPDGPSSLMMYPQNGHPNNSTTTRAKRPARAHSSPLVDSSSSAASSYYDDEDQDGGVGRLHQQQHHHVPHPHHPHQFHQMMLHAQSSHAVGGQHHNINNSNNPLANMSPSDIHPALRGRMGLPPPPSGVTSGGGIHPGLRLHISAGGMSMMTSHPPSSQGQPLIRRGTYARVGVIDRALSAFLSMDIGGEHPKQQQQQKQVVILGAGRDTSYLRYLAGLLIGEEEGDKRSNSAASNSLELEKENSVRWYEVDHVGVMKTKLELLRTCPHVNVVEARDGTTMNDTTGANEARENQSLLSYSLKVRLKNSISASSGRNGDAMDTEPTNISSAEGEDAILPYHIIGHDLRLPASRLFSTLQSTNHGFDPSFPTLFVMECVQMYMPESSARSLLQGVLSTCGSNALLALYDPILGNDGFGRVMEQHLTRAGVVAPPAKETNDQLCLTASRTLDSHLDRLVACGWNTVVGCDMLATYDTVINAEQRARANRIEMLDEIEEWMLIMRHYCFVVAGVSSSADNRKLAQRFCSVGRPPLGFVESRCSVRSPP